MSPSSRLVRTVRVAMLAIAGVLLWGCERPPMDSVQRGYRGLAMETISNPRIEAAEERANEVPPPVPPVEGGGPLASEVFQNVQVLGDLSAGEFTRLMGALTVWVAPEQGCVYCHDGGNFASENAYRKIVARRMIQMTRWINSDWNAHVGTTGVTCYTCHRGEPVPERIWFDAPAHGRLGGFLGRSQGQNVPGDTVGLTSLPFDPFGPYLRGETNVRIQSDTALPTGNEHNIKDAERTYGLMIHMSESLGVNCTYCHNSRAFKPWKGSLPARVNAWHAIRMVRGINEEYLASLTDVFPADRKGPEGDVYKVHCGTCHNGLPKPLEGVNMVQYYPSLDAQAEEPPPSEPES